MQKIKMLKSTPGAVNKGLKVVIFKEGLIYPNKEVEDLEGLDQIFLDNKLAELYVKPDEVVRHEKGLSGAPENKRAEVPENKRERPESEKFTYEELEGAKAVDIRKLALQQNPVIDLSDLAKNTSAEKLIQAYLERQ